jgi:hypothetical protein
MVCFVGGGVFDVLQATSYGHYIVVRAKTTNGDIHMITSPIESISFDIIVSAKKPDEKPEPPRKIGFIVDAQKTGN